MTSGTAFNMKLFARAYSVAGLGIASALLVSGCASQPQTLYYWGDYQKQVYRHFTKDTGPDEQITKLEAGLEKARASGKSVPPGYHAHLGILYSQSERADQMRKYFEAEKSLYPESATYVDFLLRKFKQDNKGQGNAI
jgi:hypothetical protein